VEVLRLRGNGPSNPHKKQTAHKTTGAKKAELKRKLVSARPIRKGKPPADGEPSSSSISSESHDDEVKNEDKEKEKELPDADGLLLDSSKPESSEKKRALTRDEMKANANKRRKAEQAHFLAMSTCAINTGNESDVEYDFGAEATWPLPDVKWTLPIRGFWSLKILPTGNYKRLRQRSPIN
jgi:hypothetical protein